MADYIENPPALQGDEMSQLQQLYRYLYRMSEAINNNLQAIGNNELTDGERIIMRTIIENGETPEFAWQEAQTLKSLIIKTADFVQTKISEYRMNLLGETVASGQFGRYVRNTGLDVVVNPEGITQNYSFQEIIQGSRIFEINSKNYIKCGLLRTVQMIPVYGVAIGKDIVTFSQDGTETYNDGNKVAELTSDELSFYQNGVKIASYKGNKIQFFQNGYHVMDLTKDALEFYVNNVKVGSYTANGISFLQGGVEVMNLAAGALSFKQSGVEVMNLAAGALTFKQGGNPVMQLTSSALTFKQNNVKMLEVTSGKISFYSGGTETFYIQSGVLYSTGDISISSGKKITIGDWRFDNAGAYYKKSSESYGFQLAARGDAGSNDGVFHTSDSSKGRVSLISKCGNHTGEFMFETDSYGNTKILIDGGTPSLGANGKNIPAIYGFNYYGQVATGDPNSCEANIVPQPGGGAKLIVTNVVNNSEIQLWSNVTLNIWGTIVGSSSREVKKNIKALKSKGKQIDELVPVEFRYKAEKSNQKHFGLIYEDTVGILPEICTESAGRKGINYTELVPILLKEIQELRKRVSALEAGAEEA